ncbi:hypothetical protein DFH06DRAFT_465125 [Mycena polygramma]|nr:hypothetical protein DFH06DRAFT_465125 [Mycena polygramma]
MCIGGGDECGLEDNAGMRAASPSRMRVRVDGVGRFVGDEWCCGRQWVRSGRKKTYASSTRVLLPSFVHVQAGRQFLPVAHVILLAVLTILPFLSTLALHGIFRVFTRKRQETCPFAAQNAERIVLVEYRRGRCDLMLARRAVHYSLVLSCLPSH